MQGNHPGSVLPKKRIFFSTVNVKKEAEKFEKHIKTSVSAPATPLASPTNRRDRPVFDFSVYSLDDLSSPDPTRPLAPQVLAAGNLIPREHVGAAAPSFTPAEVVRSLPPDSTPPSPPSTGSADQGKKVNKVLQGAKKYLKHGERSIVGFLLPLKPQQPQPQPMEEDQAGGSKRARSSASSNDSVIEEMGAKKKTATNSEQEETMATVKQARDLVTNMEDKLRAAIGDLESKLANRISNGDSMIEGCNRTASDLVKELDKTKAELAEMGHVIVQMKHDLSNVCDMASTTANDMAMMKNWREGVPDLIEAQVKKMVEERLAIIQSSGGITVKETIELAEKSAECGIFISGIQALRVGFRLAPNSDPATVVRMLLANSRGFVENGGGGHNMVTAWSQRDRVVIPVARGKNRASAPSAIVYFRDPQIKREVTGWVKRLLLSLKARNVSVRDLFPGEKLEEVSQLTKLGFHMKNMGRISRFRIVNIRNKPVIQVTKGNSYYYVSLTEEEIKQGLEEMQKETQTTSNRQQSAGASEDMDTAQDNSESRPVERSENPASAAAVIEENIIQQTAKNTASRINNRPSANMSGNQSTPQNGPFPPLQQRNNQQNSGFRSNMAKNNYNNSQNASQDSRSTYAEHARMGGQRPPRFGGEFYVQQRLQQISNEDGEASGGQMYDEYGFFDPSRFIIA